MTSKTVDPEQSTNMAVSPVAMNQPAVLTTASPKDYYVYGPFSRQGGREMLWMLL